MIAGWEMAHLSEQNHNRGCPSSVILNGKDGPARPPLLRQSSETVCVNSKQLTEPYQPECGRASRALYISSSGMSKGHSAVFLNPQ